MARGPEKDVEKKGPEKEGDQGKTASSRMQIGEDDLDTLSQLIVTSQNSMQMAIRILSLQQSQEPAQAK